MRIRSYVSASYYSGRHRRRPERTGEVTPVPSAVLRQGPEREVIDLMMDVPILRPLRWNRASHAASGCSLVHVVSYQPVGFRRRDV